MFTYDNNCSHSQDLWTIISKDTEIPQFMENIWKRKNITNDTKTVYWKQKHSTQCYMGVKLGHITKKIRDGKQQKLKTLMFRTVDGTNKKGRPF